MDFNILNQALNMTGSAYKAGQPVTQNPAHVASTRDPWGEAYAGNPTEYSDAHSRARATEAAQPSVQTSEQSVEQAQVSAPDAPDTTTQAAQQVLAQTKTDYASEPVEMTGQQKQNNLKNKATSIVGAVANFYGGNWLGAANSAKGIFDTSGEDKGGLMGMLGGAAGGSGSQGGGQMAAAQNILKMFGG